MPSQTAPKTRSHAETPEERSLSPDPDVQLKFTLPKEEVKISKFAGKPEELVEAWIHSYVKTTTRLQWSDKARKMNVEFYLTGRASNWYDAKYRDAPPASWKDFCDDFRGKFYTEHYRERISNLLLTCRQRHGESIDAFETRFQELCDEVDMDMSEAVRVDKFIAKLREPMRTSMMSSVLTSWEQAVMIAQKIEDGQPTARTSDSRQESRPRRSPREKTEYRRPRPPDEELRKLRTATDEPICWKCEKPGHVAKFCRARNQGSRFDDKKKQHVAPSKTKQVSLADKIPAEYPKEVLPNPRG
jgi:hypothetical protein